MDGRPPPFLLFSLGIYACLPLGKNASTSLEVAGRGERAACLHFPAVCFALKEGDAPTAVECELPCGLVEKLQWTSAATEMHAPGGSW